MEWRGLSVPITVIACFTDFICTDIINLLYLIPDTENGSCKFWLYVLCNLRSWFYNILKTLMFKEFLTRLLISDNAKRDTDTALLKAKAHYENKIVEQSTENPRGFGTIQGTTRNLPAPQTYSSPMEKKSPKTKTRPRS